MAPLDLGSLLCPVCPKGSWALSASHWCLPVLPHRTPWSSMESLRKLVSSWEHTGSDLTWLLAPSQPPGKDSSTPL